MINITGIKCSLIIVDKACTVNCNAPSPINNAFLRCLSAIFIPRVAGSVYPIEPHNKFIIFI